EYGDERERDDAGADEAGPAARWLGGRARRRSGVIARARNARGDRVSRRLGGRARRLGLVLAARADSSPATHAFASGIVLNATPSAAGRRMRRPCRGGAAGSADLPWAT